MPTRIRAHPVGYPVRPRVDKAEIEIALDKLLKGAGAGVNPTEIDVPVGVVSGLIAMWHGLIANIPSGYVICDGNNLTPNLLARFIEGVATAATDPGATGGATAKTTGGHIHYSNVGGFVEDGYRATGTPCAVEDDPGGTPHNKPIALMTSYTLKNYWQVYTDVQSNTDSIADIRPSFYDVAFIMKT